MCARKEQWIALGRSLRVGLLLLLMGGSHACILAQNDVQSTLYWAVPSLHNPAVAGSDSALHVAVMKRLQWVGTEEAPQSFFATADAPFMFLQKRFGAGVSALKEKSGLLSNTCVSAQLDMSFSLWGGRLAVGVQGGVQDRMFEGSKRKMPEEEKREAVTDTLPTTDVKGTGFDGALGLYYERSGWYGGIAVQHLLSGETELSKYSVGKQEKNYFFHAGGNIPLKNALWIIQPSLMVRVRKGNTESNFTLRIAYDQRFWTGVNLRPNDAVAFLLGARWGHLQFFYAYDLGIAQTAKSSKGSHEMMASYLMPIRLGKKKTYPHKSIRIL